MIILQKELRSSVLQRNTNIMYLNTQDISYWTKVPFGEVAKGKTNERSTGECSDWLRQWDFPMVS